VFSIDWLRGAIPVEKEICVVATKDEAIAAAKTRAPDIARQAPLCFLWLPRTCNETERSVRHIDTPGPMHFPTHGQLV
jgi:hypothetical protein